MSIRSLIASGERLISFEFFPPKSAEAEEKLWQIIRNELAPLRPDFISVTYGAGGSTRDRTLRLVERIATETEITPVAHLTTVLATEAELESILDRLDAAGVHDVLALRGDPPAGIEPGAPLHHDGLAYAVDLVRLIRARGRDHFSVGVAAYPEVHPEAADAESDARHLVEKVRAGADFVVTQFFFETRHYLDLRERARRLGLPDAVPIIPGIMPVTNLKQIERFAELSGAELPEWMKERLRAVAGDPSAVRALGVELATELCSELLEAGAPGLHFYTLNRSSATREIYKNLGLDRR